MDYGFMLLMKKLQGVIMIFLPLDIFQIVKPAYPILVLLSQT